MKERPILMSAPMVRAILNGTKTQTRRVMKPQPIINGRWIDLPKYSCNSEAGFKEGAPLFGSCPYGQAYENDRLWVREAWQGPILDSDEQLDDFRQSPDVYKKPGFCVYRATDQLDAVDIDGKELGWRPSIHMPRWASRITLEITGVRVEQLHEISYADALAEGVIDMSALLHEDWQPLDSESGDECARRLRWPQRLYKQLWESINGPGAWDANPWVWVVEFDRVQS